MKLIVKYLILIVNNHKIINILISVIFVMIKLIKYILSQLN